MPVTAPVESLIGRYTKSNRRVRTGLSEAAGSVIGAPCVE